MPPRQKKKSTVAEFQLYFHSKIWFCSQHKHHDNVFHAVGPLSVPYQPVFLSSPKCPVLKPKKTRGPICGNIWWVIYSLGVFSTGKKRERSIRLSPFTKACVSYANSFFFYGKFVNSLSMLGTGTCSLAFLFKFCQIILITYVTTCLHGLSCFSMSCRGEKPRFPITRRTTSN